MFKYQTEIADAIGITAQHLSDILRDVAHPSFGLAEKLEKETGVSWQTWMDRKTGERRKQFDRANR